MARLTRQEAGERAAEMCEDAARQLATGEFANARGFLETALGMTSAIIAAAGTRVRKVTVPEKNIRYSSSLVTGLRILECFTDAQALLGVAEVSERVSIPRSTAHRYLITLVQLGQIEQPAGAGRKYRRPEIQGPVEA